MVPEAPTVSIVTLAMEIELYGGPADGMILAVQDGTTFVMVPAPAMSPAEFIALESGAPNPSSLPIVEHIYHHTDYVGRATQLKVFTYGGTRRAR